MIVLILEQGEKYINLTPMIKENINLRKKSKE